MERHILDSAGMETGLVDRMWNHCAEGYREEFDGFFFSLSLFLFFFLFDLLLCQVNE